MTCGPYGNPPPWPRNIQDAYDALRAHCAKLEELLEVFPTSGADNEKFLKRADKAVTVMKVGFKMLKKAKKNRRDTTRLTLVK